MELDGLSLKTVNLGADTNEELDMLLDTHGVEIQNELEDRKDLTAALLQLSHQMSPSDGLMLSTVEELKKANRDLELAKQSFFQQQLVYDALNKIANEDSFDSIENEVQIEIKNLVAAAEVMQYFKLPVQLQAGDLPLGITEEHLDIAAPKISKQVLNDAVLPAIEIEVCKSMEELMKTYSEGVTLDSSAEFCTVVERDAKVILERSRKLQALEQETKSIHFDFSLQLSEMVDSLTTTLDKISLEDNVKLTEQSAKEIISRWRIFLSKAKNLHQKVLCKTYTPTKIEALRNYRSNLLSQKSELGMQIAVIESKLNNYEQLGNEFKRLVEEIRYLESEIAIRQWGLIESKSSADTF